MRICYVARECSSASARLRNTYFVAPGVLILNGDLVQTGGTMLVKMPGNKSLTSSLHRPCYRYFSNLVRVYDIRGPKDRKPGPFRRVELNDTFLTQTTQRVFLSDKRGHGL